MAAAISAVRDRIGAPASYGGAVRGPCVRWFLGDRALVLASGAEGLQLAVLDAGRLAEADRAAFDVDVHDLDFTRLPYVWQVETQEPVSRPPAAPSVPVAADWLTLEASLDAVLRSLAEQVPQQFTTAEHLGFNIATGTRKVGVASGGDGLTVMVDDRKPPGPTPAEEMRRRGWDRDLVGWWEHAVLEADEVAHAAGMLITELRHDGADAPQGLRTDDVDCTSGYLLLPGLAVAGI
ncbi:hypothetical protein ACIBK8_32815 [Streptomyces sp. NPDC050161]|uniref:hypothetical protein n=1 Tax=Streptomyces sp. NPDC050161 TaxID=3365604 RepID=UPI003794DFAE